MKFSQRVQLFYRHKKKSLIKMKNFQYLEINKQHTCQNANKKTINLRSNKAICPERLYWNSSVYTLMQKVSSFQLQAHPFSESGSPDSAKSPVESALTSHKDPHVIYTMQPIWIWSSAHLEFFSLPLVWILRRLILSSGTFFFVRLLASLKFTERSNILIIRVASWIAWILRDPSRATFPILLYSEY